MKNILLAVTIIAACSMLSASAWASDENDSYKSNSSSNENSRALSGKRLSATGRTMDQSIRASRLTGAAIQDASGNRIGQIQDIIVNPSSGRIEFAIVSLTGKGGASSPSGISTAPNAATETETSSSSSTASTSGRMIPVPWSLLKTAAESSSVTSASQQGFTLNVDQTKLNQAPTIDRNNWSEVGESAWRQRIYSFYGVSPDAAAGAAESPAGTFKGHESEKLIENQNP